MERPKYVYWMPPNKPSFILPCQHEFQVATVIKAVKGQKMDRDIYFSLLSDRVQDLINENDDPEDIVSYTFDVLERASLIYERPDDVEAAGKSFVLDNYKLRSHLYNAGTFEEMPKELIKNDPDAEQLFNENTLESWFNAVTTTLNEDYR